jgi:CRISPR-associated protein Csb1
VQVRLTEDVEVNQYTAPHRIYDAIFRDSLTPDGEPFFQGNPGKLLAKGDEKALFQWAPNVLIFGGWHSHEEESAEKAPRFPRLVLLEILGIEPRIVHRTSSRRDPLELSGQSPLPEALKEKFEGKKKLSEVGYGTLPPTKQPVEVAVEGAVLAGSVSLVALRRLSLPEEAKAILLGLILLAVVEQERTGYLLRSGTTLIPEGPLTWDPRDALAPLCKPSQQETIADPDFLVKAINELQEDVDAELAWPREPLELKPTDHLVEIFKQSRPYPVLFTGVVGKE